MVTRVEIFAADGSRWSWWFPSSCREHASGHGKEQRTTIGTGRQRRSVSALECLGTDGLRETLWDVLIDMERRDTTLGRGSL